MMQFKTVRIWMNGWKDTHTLLNKWHFYYITITEAMPVLLKELRYKKLFQPFPKNF